MGSIPSPKKPLEKRIPRNQKRLILIVGFLFVVFAVALGGLLLTSSDQSSTSLKLSGQTSTDDFVRSTPPNAVQAEFQKLVGRWRRPDSGYILEINGVHTGGKLKATYYNPHPINVSLAYAAQENEYTRVYVELRDVGGDPGATYSLTYHKEQDAFAGLYHQPTAGQTYQVNFLRQKEKGVKP